MNDKKSENNFTLGIAKNRKGENSPTHTGKLKLDGKTYYLSGWQKQNDDGSHWFSGYVNEPQDSNSTAKKKEQASNPRSGNPQDGDDIPF